MSETSTDTIGLPSRAKVVTMRVAFVGKGGSGKSSIAGVFARLLARNGERVLALDSDPMPGLAYSLGVPSHDPGIPAEAVEEYEDEDGQRRFRLRSGLDAAAAIVDYSSVGPDGVRLLQLGKARGLPRENAYSHQAYQLIVDALENDEWSVVGDLPGGTRQPFFGWGRFARTVLVVTEPTPASLLSARRLSRLAQHSSAPRVLAVANKTRADTDVRVIEHGTGLPVIGAIPYDGTQQDADRRGVALLDLDAETPMVSAIAALVSALTEQEAVR
ncbi:carbon monoxide dehydrogenase accessory protein CooC [soil metagenome]